MRSNEPQFQTALETKKTAQTHANTAPNAYRQQEQGIVTQAQQKAQTTAQTQLLLMHGEKEQLLTQVVGLQTDTKGQDEQKRSEVANHIQGIYNNTKQKVETALSQLDGEVNQQFDQGASAAKTEFENYVEGRMKRYKDERYSGFLGPGRWVVDKLFGMPGEVNAFYQEGKNKFLAFLDKTIDNIANHVAKTLNAAKSEIAKGKQEISKYVASLDPSLKQVGQQAAEEIQGKFDELEQSVDSKQDELIDNLAQKYNENLQQIDARIEQMKEENKGLVQKAIDFVVGVVKTIVELGKMLAQVLARAISVLPQILANPIGFFSNLVNGVKQGFQNFMQNIGQHLAKGLIGWLSGKVASAGVQMPESLDAKGIFTLVTQIMGLTYENVRERAAKRLGEEKVSQLESTFEMFIVLKNQGIAGLWQFIQDTIGDLNQKVMEPVRNYIIESVIKAGITWIFSLLTPASAFIKACQAIYELVMFFVERASQIVDLVNAVLDSIVAIANGAIGEAAKKIEDSLAKALPLVIDLLARVLGLGGVSQKVQGMIAKVRGPIETAIDKVIDKGAKVANKAGDKFESGMGKGKKNKDRSNKQEDKTGDRNDRTKDSKNRAGDRNGSSKDNNNKAKDNNDKKTKDGQSDERTYKQKQADLDNAVAEAEHILSQQQATTNSVKAKLPELKSKYRLKSAKLIETGDKIYQIKVQINPEDETRKHKLSDSDEEIIVPIYRGIHFLKAENNSEEDEQKYQEELKKSSIGQPTYSAAALELAKSQTFDGSDLQDKKKLEQAVEQVQQELKQKEEAGESITAWWDSSKDKFQFDNQTLALLQRYINSYGKFKQELQDNNKPKAYQGLSFSQIPFISTSWHAKHPVKYALGASLNEELQPRRRQEGVAGRVFVYLFSHKQLDEQNAADVKRLYDQNKLKVDYRKLSQDEVTFKGGIPGDNLVKQHDIEWKSDWDISKMNKNQLDRFLTSKATKSANSIEEDAKAMAEQRMNNKRPKKNESSSSV